MKNMPTNKSIISLAVGSAFAAALGTASIASATDSPFTVQSLGKGYMVADSHDYSGKDASGSKKPEGRCGMAMADTDGDGRVSREEHARHADKMFDMMDKNKDGYIDKDEAAAMRKKHAQGHHGHGQANRQGYTEGVDEQQMQHMKRMGD